MIVKSQQLLTDRKNIMDQTSINTDFSKIHDQSLTQDTTSVLIAIEPPILLLAQKISTKFQCAWGRVFFSRMKSYTRQKLRERSNLALILAQRMPPAIKDQVTKIVKYYEQHMEDQLNQIHSLVSENNRLRKIIQSKEEEKQNIPKQAECGSNKNERVSELENSLMEKNKQIVGLNQEVTELLGKVKKYKKRVYELESKSPIKTVSQF